MQLAAVPVPTTVVGCDVSAGCPAAGTPAVHEPSGLPACVGMAAPRTSPRCPSPSRKRSSNRSPRWNRSSNRCPSSTTPACIGAGPRAVAPSAPGSRGACKRGKRGKRQRGQKGRPGHHEEAPRRLGGRIPETGSVSLAGLAAQPGLEGPVSSMHHPGPCPASTRALATIPQVSGHGRRARGQAVHAARLHDDPGPKRSHSLRLQLRPRRAARSISSTSRRTSSIAIKSPLVDSFAAVFWGVARDAKHVFRGARRARSVKHPTEFRLFEQEAEIVLRRRALLRPRPRHHPARRADLCARREELGASSSQLELLQRLPGVTKASAGAIRVLLDLSNYLMDRNGLYQRNGTHAKHLADRAGEGRRDAARTAERGRRGRDDLHREEPARSQLRVARGRAHEPLEKKPP